MPGVGMSKESFLCRFPPEPPGSSIPPCQAREAKEQGHLRFRGIQNPCSSGKAPDKQQQRPCPGRTQDTLAPAWPPHNPGHRLLPISGVNAPGPQILPNSIKCAEEWQTSDI